MYLDIAIKLIIGMLGVLFFLRLAGKAQMAQITPLDTVSAFVIGALVGGVIYNPDMHVLHLLFAIGVWTIFNLLIRYSLRFRIARKIFKGDSIYIIKDNILNVKALKRNGMEMEQLRTLLREAGVFSMFAVHDVRFETNGKLTVSTQGKASESFLLVNNGTILDSSLNNAGKTREWLLGELDKLGYKELRQLFCVEWTTDRGFYIVQQDGKIQYGNVKMKRSKIDEQVSA